MCIMKLQKESLWKRIVFVFLSYPEFCDLEFRKSYPLTPILRSFHCPGPRTPQNSLRWPSWWKLSSLSRAILLFYLLHNVCQDLIWLCLLLVTCSLIFSSRMWKPREPALSGVTLSPPDTLKKVYHLRKISLKKVSGVTISPPDTLKKFCFLFSPRGNICSPPKALLVSISSFLYLPNWVEAYVAWLKEKFLLPDDLTHPK